MAERIEFRGDSLPSGFPGFGGGSTVDVALNGLGSFVRPVLFGAVNNATVTPPSSTPPVGSNPAVPTPTVVPPAAAPPDTYITTNVTNVNNTTNVNNITVINSICPDCRTEEDVGTAPMLTGFRTTTGTCYDCNGIFSNRTRYFSTPAVQFSGGIYYGGVTKLEGRGLGGASNSWSLDTPGVVLKSKLYGPQTLQVCEGGATKTWEVLAYKT